MQIGREIYTHEITISEATEKYSVNGYTARSYMRQYRDINKHPPMSDWLEELNAIAKIRKRNTKAWNSCLKINWLTKLLELASRLHEQKRLCCQRRWSEKEIYHLECYFLTYTLCCSFLIFINRSLFLGYRFICFFKGCIFWRIRCYFLTYTNIGNLPCFLLKIQKKV